MRQAIIYVNGIKAGFLEELVYKTSYSFTYDESYNGHPVSLTMPLKQSKYECKYVVPPLGGIGINN